MQVPKHLLSPVKIRIFCPKKSKFGPNLAFLVNLRQVMQAYSMPCWWVGWCLWRAGCISQDTYLLYFLTADLIFSVMKRDGVWSRVPELMSPKHFQCCSAFCKILRHSPNISIKKVGVKYMQGTRKAWNGLYGSPNYLITYGYRMWY